MASARLEKMVDGAPDGPVPPDIVANTKEPGPAIVGGLLTLYFIFIVYLMVAQPAW
jgi:hypothetical protein